MTSCLCEDEMLVNAYEIRYSNISFYIKVPEKIILKRLSFFVVAYYSPWRLGFTKK